jgi:hypothetical protein
LKSRRESKSLSDYACLIFVLRVFWGNPVKGWAPMMIVFLVISGVHLLMLGIIGEYVWRSLAQTRGRVLYVIEETYD